MDDERRYTEAINVLKNAIAKHDRRLTDWQRADYGLKLALMQQFSGDIAGANVTWQQLRDQVEILLGAITAAYTALGEKTKARTLIDQAEAEEPGDVFRAAWFTEVRARIAVQAGDKDLAVEQLEISARDPVGMDYGDLKFNPLWDPLRGDPRFEKIVASLAPKDAGK
jgi:hypothetical protein